MKDRSDTIEDENYPRPFTLIHLSAQIQQQGFDVIPLDICSCGHLEDGVEYSLVFALHGYMVSQCDTIFNRNQPIALGLLIKAPRLVA